MEPSSYQSEHVSLWVYVRGEAARDLPYALWKMIEDAGDWNKLFWYSVYTPTRIPRLGDLADWVYYMHDPNNDKVFTLLSDTKTGNICGVGWYDHIVDGESAHTALWIAPAYRFHYHAREAAKLGIEFGHKEMGWPMLYTKTPWPIARNLARKAGFKDILCDTTNSVTSPIWVLQHEEIKHGCT